MQGPGEPSETTELAEQLLRQYFPDQAMDDTVPLCEVLDLVVEALLTTDQLKVPSLGVGDWLDIKSVSLGTRVVAPFDKGLGCMVGVIKMCPYGTGARVVSDGVSFVTPQAVKRVVEAV